MVIVVESDKGEAPVRSTHKGVISSYLFNEGDDVKIGTPLFELDTDGKASPSASESKQEAPKKEEKKEEKKEVKKEETKKEEAAPKKQETASQPQKSTPKPASGSAVQGDTIKFSNISLSQPNQSMRDRRIERRCPEPGKQFLRGSKNLRTPTLQSRLSRR